MVEKNSDEMFCHSCGEVIKREAEICPKCGVRQKIQQTVTQNLQQDISLGQKNKIIAAIFAILLGGIGIHKFYLGRVGAGIVYILFCWTGIPSLIGLFEGIAYLLMTDIAFKAKYR